VQHLSLSDRGIICHFAMEASSTEENQTSNRNPASGELINLSESPPRETGMKPPRHKNAPPILGVRSNAWLSAARTLRKRQPWRTSSTAADWWYTPVCLSRAVPHDTNDRLVQHLPGLHPCGGACTALPGNHKGEPATD